MFPMSVVCQNGETVNIKNSPALQTEEGPNPKVQIRVPLHTRLHYSYLNMGFLHSLTGPKWFLFNVYLPVIYLGV